MKIGAEERSKVGWLLALLAIGILSLTWAFWPSPAATANQPTSSGVNVPTAQRAASRLRGRKNSTSAAVLNSTDPTIRLSLLENSEDVTYRGTGRNIFASSSEPTPEVGKRELASLQSKKCKISPDAPGCPGYDPCKVDSTQAGCKDYRPPIDIKFYGFANHAGEPKKVFLSQGEEIFVAREGDIVNRRYKVLKIGVSSVQIQDVSNNNTQTIPLTQG